MYNNKHRLSRVSRAPLTSNTSLSEDTAMAEDMDVELSDLTQDDLVIDSALLSRYVCFS